MELLTQIWQSVGGPLTTLLWIYIVYVLIIMGCAGTVFFMVFRIFWKNRNKFGGWD
jgi:hypothetical protein